MAIIDNPVILATAHTFDSQQRKQAIINLRILANNRNSVELTHLANAFETNQANDVVKAIEIFHVLYSQADNIGDRVHFGTKACCATAPVVDKGKHDPRVAGYTLWPALAKIPEYSTIKSIEDLEKFRRKQLNTLIAEALQKEPSFADLDKLYEVLKHVKPNDLHQNVLPTTFAYAAIAALNCNEVPGLPDGNNQARLAAFANVLKNFGQEFPRGYLIYVRHLLKANQLDEAINVLQDPSLQKHAANNHALATIIQYTQKITARLQQASNEQARQAILTDFTRTDADPLGHPVSMIADSWPVRNELCSTAQVQRLPH